MKRLTSTMQKKFRNCIKTATAITLLSFPATVKAESCLFYEVGSGYEENTIDRVDKIPLRIRNVPKHSNDFYAQDTNVAPIQRDYANLYGHHNPIKTKIGIKGLLGRLIPSIGIGIDLPLITLDIARRNYTDNVGSEQRGDGAALTYYEVSTLFWPTSNDIRLSIFSELELFVNTKFGVAIGYSLFKESLIAENGWDRYNKLEVKDRYDLADLVVGQPYISFRFHTERDSDKEGIYADIISLNLGFKDVINTRKIGLGKDVDIRLDNKSLFAYLTIGAALK